MKATKKSKATNGRAIAQPDSKSALHVTDIQNDFCPGGALGVPGADAIIPIVNDYIRFFHRQGFPVIASRDWHPPNHCSFKEQNGIWPVHCVQGSWGGQFHPKLVMALGVIILSRATDPKREAYSAFEGTPLDERLRNLGTETLFVTGLATDYCVRNTVLDACKLGYRVLVLEDAIRGLDATPGDCERAMHDMRAVGAITAKARDLGL